MLHRNIDRGCQSSFKSFPSELLKDLRKTVFKVRLVLLSQDTFTNSVAVEIFAGASFSDIFFINLKEIKSGSLTRQISPKDIQRFTDAVVAYPNTRVLFIKWVYRERPYNCLENSGEKPYTILQTMEKSPTLYFLEKYKHVLFQNYVSVLLS